LVIFLGVLFVGVIFVQVARIGFNRATIILAVLASAAVVGALVHFNRLYPHRDELDRRERAEIDAIVRFALDALAERADFSGVTLDDEDRGELLDLYKGRDLPSAYRRIVLRELESSLLPDI
jgi:hypothetical protein